MEMLELFTRYIYGSGIFDTLVKENAEFFTVNRRSWTQQELSKRLREIIEEKFSDYTSGANDEVIVIGEIITSLPYFGLACAIYPNLYNSTLLYRTGQGDLVIDVNKELDGEFTSTETAFYENSLLNYK